jgi:release factor glutamine methyltransferase
MYGRTWDLLPEVFAPIYSPSTGVAMDLLGLGGSLDVPRTGSFLEIGCGTGIIAVSAALAGCDRVVAADINPAAARNAAMNADRHGVGGRFTAMHSDLFAQLDEHERFDTIFWSSNYVDPGYRTHHRFLAAAPRWLTPGGVILLHFSTRGDLPGLLRAAGEHGLALRMLCGRVIQEGDVSVEHMLVQVALTARPAELGS